MNTTPTTVPTTLVATVARDGARMTGGRVSRPIWTGALYRPQPRKRDGVLTYRRVGTFGGTRSGFNPSATFVAYLQHVAPAPFVVGIRHGQPVAQK